MSWNRCESSGRNGCALGLQAGNHRFEASLCLTFSYVHLFDFFTYVKKVNHRPASNWSFPACKPRAQLLCPDNSHWFQDILTYFNRLHLCLSSCQANKYDHLFKVMNFSHLTMFHKNVLLIWSCNWIPVTQMTTRLHNQLSGCTT